MNEQMVLKGEDKVEVGAYNPSGSREVAEVQSAMVIAKRFPRDEKAAMDRIINACSREGLAAAARYQYARAGTDISGPSIRLAECLAQCWGNLQFGIRELEQANGESVVESFCWDVETNTRSTKTFKVPHVRYSRGKGNVRLEDPRDIYEGVANQAGRRLRACILAVIPGDITESALRQCDETLAAKVRLTPERVKSMLDKFLEIGVTKSQIEKKIQRRLDTITPAQFVNLGNIFNSIRDEMSKPGDWFEEEADPTEKTDDSVKRGKSLKETLSKSVFAAPKTPPDSSPPTSAFPNDGDNLNF